MLINKIFGILFTAQTMPARIYMSGSARVAKNPKSAPKSKIIQVLLNFIRAEPECFPIFTIEWSAPVINNNWPIKTIKALSKSQ